MEQIIAVHRNIFGDIISFQTSDMRIISYQKALQEVENGIISGVNIVEKEEKSYLKPTEENNFDHYPLFY